MFYLRRWQCSIGHGIFKAEQEKKTEFCGLFRPDPANFYRLIKLYS
jgi:hypothetical protein